MKYLILSLSILPCWLLSQYSFQAEYGSTSCNYSEIGKKIISSHDGGAILVGATACYGSGSYDMSFVKLNNQGSIIWAKTIGGTSQDYAVDVIPTSDTNYAAVGYIKGGGAGYSDMAIIKFDDNGDTIWTCQTGRSSQDYGYAITETSDEGYVGVGSSRKPGVSDDDIFVVKVDNNGIVEWNKTFGSSSSDVAKDVIELKDSNLLICGYTSGYGAGSNDVLLIKTNPNGQIIWSNTYGDSLTNYSYSVKQTSDGGFIVCGEIIIPYDFGTVIYNYADILLLKIDKDGKLQWSKKYGLTTNDTGYDIIEVADDGYLICGESQNGGGQYYDLILLKIDAVGIIEWGKSYGTNDTYQYGGRMAVASDGGFLFTGQTQKTIGVANYQQYVVKTDKDIYAGCNLSTFNFNEDSLEWIRTEVNFDTDSVVNTIEVSTPGFQSQVYDEMVYCIKGELTANFSFTESCAGDFSNFSALSATASYWYWDFGNLQTTNDTSFSQNPTYFYSDTGTYEVMLIVGDSAGVYDTAYQNVVITNGGNLLISGDSVYCEEDRIELTASGGNTYLWSTGATTTTIFEIADSSQYFVVQDTSSNCISIDSIFVTVNEPPDFFLANDTILASGDSMTLNIYSNNPFTIVSSVWFPSDGVSCDTCLSTTITPTQTTTYYVTIYDANGCMGVDSITIEVGGTSSVNFKEVESNQNIYELNKLVSSGQFSEITFRLYSVSGELIMEDLTGDQLDYLKEMKLPNSIYFYIFSGKTINGNLLQFSEKILME